MTDKIDQVIFTYRDTSLKPYTTITSNINNLVSDIYSLLPDDKPKQYDMELVMNLTAALKSFVWKLRADKINELINELPNEEQNEESHEEYNHPELSYYHPPRY